MTTLLELVSEIVEAHASVTSMTTEELLAEIKLVHEALKKLEEGQALNIPAVEEQKPELSAKKSIRNKEIICLVCGKGGMKTLSRHLSTAHGMTPGEYRKQFGIPGKQPLAAKSFSEERRKLATEHKLADNLAKAREARKAKLAASAGKAQKKTAKSGATKPAKPAKPGKA